MNYNKNKINIKIKNRKFVKKNFFSLNENDFSLTFSNFSKFENSIIAENLLKISTENRREITTKNRVKVEIVISIEKNKFETFAEFFDRIIIINKILLNDILIEIRMNFQITNKNIEIKNKNFTQKLHEKITIFMKIHLFFCLNIQKIERSFDVFSIIENFEKTDLNFFQINDFTFKF